MDNTNKLPQGGEDVNDRGELNHTPAPKRAYGGVPDLEEFRRKREEERKRDREHQQQAQVMAWLDAHGVDAKGKPKPPTIDSIYAHHLCSGAGGLWSCQSGDGTGSVIHAWNGVYWKAMNTEVGVGVVSEWLESVARHTASAKAAEKCWAYASVRLRQRNPLPAADPKRAIIPCADTYVEIKPEGFEVLAPDPALGMVHAVNVKCRGKVGKPYNPRELPQDSLFYKFLAHAQPDPAVRAVIQEQCGMTLLPGNYSQAAWWYGKAGSGKSTLAELVEAMHRQAVRINLETLGDRFSLEPLIGASLILVDEVECEKWAEGRFKTVVSGNGIGIDRKNEKALASYHSRAKWIITSNGAPFVRDKSDGVWRRLTVVQWNNAVPASERVGDLQKLILENEAQLVLDWMLEGARRIVARGRALAEHELPDAVNQAKRGARHNSDSVRAWSFEERVGTAPGKWVPLEDVYAHYKSWCEAQGYTDSETLTSRQFWRGMTEIGLVDPSKKANKRVNQGNLKGKQKDHYELEILGRDVQQAPAASPEPITWPQPISFVIEGRGSRDQNGNYPVMRYVEDDQGNRIRVPLDTQVKNGPWRNQDGSIFYTADDGEQVYLTDRPANAHELPGPPVAPPCPLDDLMEQTPAAPVRLTG